MNRPTPRNTNASNEQHGSTSNANAIKYNSSRTDTDPNSNEGGSNTSSGVDADAVDYLAVGWALGFSSRIADNGYCFDN